MLHSRELHFGETSTNNSFTSGYPVNSTRSPECNQNEFERRMGSRAKTKELEDEPKENQKPRSEERSSRVVCSEIFPRVNGQKSPQGLDAQKSPQGLDVQKSPQELDVQISPQGLVDKESPH